MNKTMITASWILSAIITFSSCSNNTQSHSTDTATEQHDHEDHDHSSHAHSTTETKAQANASPVTQSAPSQTIPSFKFFKVKSGIAFTNEDLPKGKKTVFILFDPSCGHCKSEANAIGKNYTKLKDINLYFVSMNDPALMSSFLETFAKELVGKANVEVLYDRNQDFVSKFHIPDQFPANYIYTADGQLQTYWTGDKNIGDIITAYNK